MNAKGSVGEPSVRVPLSDDVRAALELAASSYDCDNRWDEFQIGFLCEAARCVHCRTAELLPELWCKCGAFQLDRASPSMWDGRTPPPINHTQEKCATPPKPTHCATCKQPLPTVEREPQGSPSKAVQVTDLPGEPK